MAFYKNKASQYIYVFAWDTSANTPKTGDAANITAYLQKDGGTPAAITDTNPTEVDATNMKGLYRFDCSQTESNADCLVLSPSSTTSNIVLDPVVIYTEPEVRSADVLQINSSTTAAQLMAILANVGKTGTVDNTAFTPTQTEFESDDITDAQADLWINRGVAVTSGSLTGFFTVVTDYYVTGGRGHFTVKSMPIALSNNDTFILF